MAVSTSKRRLNNGWWFVLVFLVSGIAGGTGGAAFARLTIHGEPGTSYLELSPLPYLIGAAGWAAGVVAGWFVAIVALTRTPGRVRCPRCGTANKVRASLCRACDLPLG